MNPSLVEDTHALLLELRRLRSEGVREIYVEEKTLRALEEAFPTTVQASQPEGNVAIESESVRELATPGKRPEESKSVVRYAEPIQFAGSLPKPPVLELPEGTKTEQWNWLKEKVLNGI